MYIKLQEGGRIKVAETLNELVLQYLKKNGIKIQRGRKAILEYNIPTSVQTLTDNAEG